MKDGPATFRVRETIKWNDIYLSLSYSEKYVGYGTDPTQLEEIRIDSIFWQHIFLPENKQAITNYVINPDWDKIYRRMVGVDIRDSVIFCHGLFVIDRIFEKYSDAHLLAMTIHHDLRSKESGMKIHVLKNQDMLTAYQYICYTREKNGDDKPNFHVSYRNIEDSSSFMIDSDGPYVPKDFNLRNARSIDNENRLVYAPNKWAANYFISPDSSLDVYSTGYEIIDMKQKKVIFRSDSLYGICSPLFLYQGKVCVLAQLVNHQTIMRAFDVLDQKIISIVDNEFLPLPEGFIWRNHFVIPRSENIAIPQEFEAISFDNEETRLVKVRF